MAVRVPQSDQGVVLPSIAGAILPPGDGTATTRGRSSEHANRPPAPTAAGAHRDRRPVGDRRPGVVRRRRRHVERHHPGDDRRGLDGRGHHSDIGPASHHHLAWFDRTDHDDRGTRRRGHGDDGGTADHHGRAQCHLHDDRERCWRHCPDDHDRRERRGAHGQRDRRVRAGGLGQRQRARRPPRRESATSTRPTPSIR